MEISTSHIRGTNSILIYKYECVVLPFTVCIAMVLFTYTFADSIDCT